MSADALLQRAGELYEQMQRADMQAEIDKAVSLGIDCKDAESRIKTWFAPIRKEIKSRQVKALAQALCEMLEGGAP